MGINTVSGAVRRTACRQCCSVPLPRQDCSSKRPISTIHRAVCVAASSVTGRVPKPGAIFGARTARPAARAVGVAGAVVRASADSRLQVNISVQKPVQFGQCLKVIGNHPELGGWSLWHAPSMEWTEGDVWRASVMLPVGTWEFKCVIVAGEMEEWEEGENRLLEIPNIDDGCMDVNCEWSVTRATLSMMSIDESYTDGGLTAEISQSSLDGAGQGGDGVEAAALNLQSASLLVSDSDRMLAAARQKMAAREWIASWRAKQASAASSAAHTNSTPPLTPSTADSQAATPKAERGPSVAGAEAEAEAKPEAEVETVVGSVVASPPSANAEPQKEKVAVVRGGTESVTGTAAMEVGAGVAWVAILASAAALPTVAWSEWTLFCTGCGLPPGPSGLLGAAEGVSYLTVAAIALWSVSRKVNTGKGLPAGPAGLLGAVEGLTFLTILAGAGVLGYQYYDRGFIPSALPDSACYGDTPIEPLDLSTLNAAVRSLSDAVDAQRRNIEAIDLGPVRSAITATSTGIGASLTSAANDATNAIQGIDLAPVQSALTTAASDIGNNLTTAAGEVSSAIQAVELAPMKAAVSATANDIAVSLNSAANDATNAIRAIDITPMKEAISSAANDVANAIRGIDIAPMKDAITSTANGMGASLTSAANNATNAIRAVDLTPMKDAVTSTAGGMGSGLTSAANDASSALRSVDLGPIQEGISSTANDLGSKLSSSANDIGGAITSTTSDLGSSVSSVDLNSAVEELRERTGM